MCRQKTISQLNVSEDQKTKLQNQVSEMKRAPPGADLNYWANSILTGKSLANFASPPRLTESDINSFVNRMTAITPVSEALATLEWQVSSILTPRSALGLLTGAKLPVKGPPSIALPRPGIRSCSHCGKALEGPSAHGKLAIEQRHGAAPSPSICDDCREKNEE
jgi:hypothetical protein